MLRSRRQGTPPRLGSGAMPLLPKAAVVMVLPDWRQRRSDHEAQRLAFRRADRTLKKLVWFEHSGHEPFVDVPGKFNAAMAELVRAAALRPPSTCRVTLDGEQIYETCARQT